jgi:hypothetical protein
MIATSTRRRTLRLGTRGSVLARTQSRWIASQLQRRHPGLKVQLVVCHTTAIRQSQLEQFRVRAAVGARGGSGRRPRPRPRPAPPGVNIVQSLAEQHAQELLAGTETMATR